MSSTKQLDLFTAALRDAQILVRMHATLLDETELDEQSCKWKFTSFLSTLDNLCDTMGKSLGLEYEDMEQAFATVQCESQQLCAVADMLADPFTDTARAQ